MTNLKTRKITIEWEDVGPEIPQWLKKVIADGRCKSFEVKTGVSKEEFQELAAKKLEELGKMGLPVLRDDVVKLAEAFIEIEYYIK